MQLNIEKRYIATIISVILLLAFAGYVIATAGVSHSWNELTDIPAGFADGVDDTGAAAGSNVYYGTNIVYDRIDRKGTPNLYTVQDKVIDDSINWRDKQVKITSKSKIYAYRYLTAATQDDMTVTLTPKNYDLLALPYGESNKKLIASGSVNIKPENPLRCYGAPRLYIYVDSSNRLVIQNYFYGYRGGSGEQCEFTTTITELHVTVIPQPNKFNRI
ncbi:MAG: hypothetical protein PVG65_06910 [Candidatus Thorarchaeota archaeon]|jgi:hypothetical protein